MVGGRDGDTEKFPEAIVGGGDSAKSSSWPGHANLGANEGVAGVFLSLNL